MTNEEKWTVAFYDALFTLDTLLENAPSKCDPIWIYCTQEIPKRYGSLEVLHDFIMTIATSDIVR
jgi:hypothetical protein